MNNYWETRMIKNLTELEDMELEFERTLTSLYQKAISELQKELELLYLKYSVDSNISLLDIKKSLSNRELVEIKKDISNYIELLNQYENTHLNSFLVKLEKMKTRVKISRLQAIMLEYEYELNYLLAEQEKQLTKMYQQAFEQSYLNTTYALQVELGVGVSFTRPTTELVLAVLKEKFLEENFSDRIWKNRTTLISTLQQELLQAFAQGKSNEQVANNIAKKMNVSLRSAKTLSRTEMNNICNQAALTSYIDQKVDEYIYLATLDTRTSEICRSLDNRVFLVKDAQRGINYPPMHPHCRSTTIPKVNKVAHMKRLAKSKDNYYLVENISYKQWEKKYL